MTLRINTLWCEFVQEDTEKPTIKDCFKWIFDNLKNNVINFEEKLLGIQNEPNGFFLKFNEPAICNEIITKTNGEGKIKNENGSITPLRLSYAGIGFRKIRIFRLPFEMSNQDIKTELANYGNILEIQDEYWSELYAPKQYKLKNGNRVAQCILKKHIPSFIYIKGHRALITYENQPKTCAYCGSNDHLIALCGRRAQARENKSSYSEALQNNNNVIIPPINAETIENNAEITVPRNPEIQQPVDKFDTLHNTNTETEPSKKTQKRAHTSSSNDEAGNEIEVETVQPSTSIEDKTKPNKKKPKEEFNFEEHIQPFIDIIDLEPDNYILSSNQLIGFLKKTSETSNLLETARKFTDKIDKLIEMLQIVHKKLSDRSTKVRITRIINQLTIQLETSYLSSAELENDN